jgi:hypothetical protein
VAPVSVAASPDTDETSIDTAIVVAAKNRFMGHLLVNRILR